MKAISARPVLVLEKKARLVEADNYGGKEVEIISVLKHRTRKRGRQKAGIASLVVVVIKKGKPEVRKKVEKAVVVRTKKEYRRSSGIRIKFEDNAVVIVDDKGVPKGSEIKGVIAKEVGERWPKVAGIAPMVV
ncbi:MAG: uL14 family ribosomal protein [Candidatus Diapherotrites archaeon]|nr:uL14 family ribosomal protein [Candidatus Diapherotrites archaeon]